MINNNELATRFIMREVIIKDEKDKKVKEFYIHLITFIVVVIALTIISLIQNEYRFYWLLFPIGFSVFWQALRTFLFDKNSCPKEENNKKK